MADQDMSVTSTPIDAEAVAVPRQRRPDRLAHWLFLGMSSAILLAAVLLEVRGETGVGVPLIGQNLPSTCTYRQLVGTDCPGCGLTRCFISLAHGDVVAAWHFNPAGLLLFVFVAVQIPYRVIQLVRIRKGLPELRPYRLANVALVTMVVALATQWLLRTFVL